MKAILRKIRISPKKANLVAGMIRGKKVNEALALLKFTPKKEPRSFIKLFIQQLLTLRIILNNQWMIWSLLRF